jgi:pimeloyl-ACP methyl ester carboxylesterase
MALVEHREVVLHGHRMAFRSVGELAGRRPILLLIHGLAGTSSCWTDLIMRVGSDVDVLAPDLFGHGASDKPRQDYSLGAHANSLRDLMLALGIDGVTIVGHSLGGGIAMQLAYQHPERCERLVLVSSGGLGAEVSLLLRLLSLPGAEYLLPVMAPRFITEAGNGIGRQLGRLGVRWPTVEQSWRAYASLARPENRRSFVQTLRSVISPSGQIVNANDRLYLAAHLPTLIVWGAADRVLPVAHASAAHASLPGSDVVILDRSGHFPQNEEPDAFAEAVRAFLDRTEAARWDETIWHALLEERGLSRNAAASGPAVARRTRART